MAKRDIPEINAGSMADIAFLLLIFFLVATTMDVDTGITRLLPPIPDKDIPQDEIKVKERNVLVVLINKDDQLMVEGQISSISELKDKTMEFFSNPLDDPDLPEKEAITVDFPAGQSSQFPDGTAELLVSKGVVSLQNDRSTTYGKYLVVQNELVAAVSELRNQFAREYFGRNYDDLDPKNAVDEAIIDGINKVYKMNISEAEPKNIGGSK
ncbi:MAG: biopolymer transporter ExbD [Bacteroidales bacterium]|nr:biopolymer transporter ExbD [Bacteroidales bacterium]